MAIHPQRVVAGGIAAGVVMAGLAFIANGFLFAEQNRTAMEALDPALIASLLYAVMTVVGMYSWSYFALGTSVALVTFIVPALIGAMLYKEGQ